MSHPLPRILLVEDDLSLAKAYQVRLEAEGFDVHLCTDGTKALTAAAAYKPELILLDVMMPRISGYDVLTILRGNPKTAHIKIIILTALSQAADRNRAKELGADEFLVKSQAIIADVIKRIRFHLRLKDASRAT